MPPVSFEQASIHAASTPYSAAMSVIIILILASLAVGLLFVGAFIWSVRSGQYEDTQTPAMRVLGDEGCRGAGDETVPSQAPQQKPNGTNPKQHDIKD
jgi:cbb3-type cytochrome oxidase maturation protein